MSNHNNQMLHLKHSVLEDVRKEIERAMTIDEAGCIALLKQIVEYYQPPTLNVGVSPPDTTTFFRGEEINIRCQLCSGKDGSPLNGNVHVRLLFPTGAPLPVGVIVVKGYEKFSEFDVAVDVNGATLFIGFPQLSKAYGGSFIIEIEISGGQKWIFPVRVLCKRSHNSHRLRSNVSSSQSLRALQGFGKTLCERMEREGIATIREFALLTEPNVRSLAKRIHSARSSMTLEKFLSAWKTARGICESETFVHETYVGDNVDWQVDDSDEAISIAVPVSPAVIYSHIENSYTTDDAAVLCMPSSNPPMPVATPLVGCPSMSVSSTNSAPRPTCTA